jgi:hypothetical protein
MPGPGVTPCFAELHAPLAEKTVLQCYEDESCKALLMRLRIDAVTTVTVPWRRCFDWDRQDLGRRRLTTYVYLQLGKAWKNYFGGKSPQLL